ncbi:hypothetical protein [Bartonella sp. TS25HLJMH]|uniref:hypothetical protein n=1 Tax=Bartonella sp. TS25HLJMH TaxID=3243576 RepID=UPI0035CF1417
MLKVSETAALITICQVHGRRYPLAIEAVGFLLEEGGMDTERLESFCVPLRPRDEACRASAFVVRVVGVMLTRFAV